MQHRVGLTRAEFARFKPLQRIQGALFTLLVGVQTDSSARTACVVSKRVSARATVRNTVKRRCREALRKTHALSEHSRTLVFHAKSAASNASFADVVRDIEALLRRIK